MMHLFSLKLPNELHQDQIRVFKLSFENIDADKSQHILEGRDCMEINNEFSKPNTVPKG